MEKAIGPGPNYPFREAVAPTPGLTILAYPVTGMVDETTMRWNKSSPETRHGSGPALASELFTGDSYHGQYETGPNQPRRVDWLSIKLTRLNDVPLAAQHHAFMRRDTRPNQPRSDLDSDWLLGKQSDESDVPAAGLAPCHLGAVGYSWTVSSECQFQEGRDPRAQRAPAEASASGLRALLTTTSGNDHRTTNNSDDDGDAHREGDAHRGGDDAHRDGDAHRDLRELAWQ